MSMPTFGSSGLAEIQSRIAQLQSYAPPLSFAGAGSAGGSAFADALAAAQSNGAGATGQAERAAPTSAQVGEQAVALAKEYLGVPYVWGGTDPDKGLDCSGLTQLVFKRLGIDLPRVSRDQATVGTEVASLKEARPGDLLFFHDPVDHVAIYAGDGMMVEAPHRGADVRVHRVWATPTHIRRVTGPDAADAGGLPGMSVDSLQALLAGTGATGAGGLGGLSGLSGLSGVSGLGGAASGSAGAMGKSGGCGTWSWPGRRSSRAARS